MLFIVFGPEKINKNKSYLNNQYWLSVTAEIEEEPIS